MRDGVIEARPEVVHDLADQYTPGGIRLTKDDHPSDEPTRRVAALRFELTRNFVDWFFEEFPDKPVDRFQVLVSRAILSLHPSMGSIPGNRNRLRPCATRSRNRRPRADTSVRFRSGLGPS